jgi:mannose-1-phosphate guanylyltransferase/phosphomannomutase
MALQAIIMAGGEGVRLRPLTLDKPKPLVPVLNEPVMGYSLKLLHRHGLLDVAATVAYLPQAIRDAFGKGEKYGVRLRYFEEAHPMGTAGSVRTAHGMVADTFVVLSGDGLTDCDLTEAIAFHKSKKALATLVLKSVPVPLSYGVVITDGEGRVQRFVEKPDWSGVFSDQVNTGIYILEKEVLDLIPEDKPYDFGKDLFPRMVREGMAVYGYPMDGYWCDIGDQGAYVAAQLALLRGEADLPVNGQPSGRAFLEGTCTLELGVKIEGLCYIGEGALIRQGAILSEGAVIGPGAVVEEGARIARTCLWENVRVGRCARLAGAVLCRDAVVYPGGRMMEGSALGVGAVLGSHARLDSGVKVWPQKEVASDVVAVENVVWGDLKRLHLSGDGQATLDSPARADQLAASAIAGLCIPTVALCYRGDGEALYLILAGAFAARGAEVMLLGAGYAPVLMAAQRLLNIPLGVMADGQQARLLGALGLPLSRKQIQTIESSAQRQEYPPAFSQTAALTPISGMEELYLARLLHATDAKALEKSGLHAAVFCDDPTLLQLALRLLRKAGIANVRGQDASSMAVNTWETGFLLEEDGSQIRVVSKNGMPDDLTQQLLTWQLAAREGSLPLFAFPDTPRALGDIGPVRWKWDEAALTNEERAALLRQHDLHHDGLLAMLAFISVLAGGGLSLQNLLDQLPKAHRVRIDVPCPPGEKGRILRLLSETARDKELGEGVRIRHGSGSVWLTPFQDRAAFRVQTESFDAEFANELCSHYSGRIARLARLQAKKDEKGSPSSTQ